MGNSAFSSLHLVSGLAATGPLVVPVRVSSGVAQASAPILPTSSLTIIQAM